MSFVSQKTLEPNPRFAYKGFNSKYHAINHVLTVHYSREEYTDAWESLTTDDLVKEYAIQLSLNQENVEIISSSSITTNGLILPVKMYPYVHVCKVS